MSLSIADAVKKARYNEVVVVTVPSENNNEDNSREIMLSACLDEKNGGIIFNDISSQAPNQVDVFIRRHLQTKRWVFPMLNDNRRNELYNSAIRQASEELSKQLSNSPIEEIHVLDIGSGTGLLAMIAAQHMTELMPKKKVDVTSFEMSSAMAKLAKLLVTSNKKQNIVKIVEGHSCETASMSNKAHLCTSELLESGLLGEGILPSLRDAWERHLCDDAIIVPRCARVICQIVDGDDIGNLWGPHSTLSGFPKGNSLQLSTSTDDKDVMLGGGGDCGILLPVHADKLFGGKYKLKTLCEPTQVLDIDFSSKDAIPGSNGQRKTTSITPTSSGYARAILFWWELDLWKDLMYSTGAGVEPWQDHWHQCLFVFTKHRKQCVKLTTGESCLLEAGHNDQRVFFSVSKPSEKPPEPKRVCIKDTSEMISLISPERAWQLNDINRLTNLRRAIANALEQVGQKGVVLDLSDFSLCAMIASLESSGKVRVSSLEDSSGDIPMTSARVAQLANGLPIDEEVDPTSFQILQCHAEQLTVDILGGDLANLIFAEPYYEVLEGNHLQEALNYFYLVRSLKERNVISKNALSVPSYASVMGSAIQSTNICQAYRACKSSIFDVNHDIVNKYGDRFNEYDLSIPMWQYEHSFMTDPFEIARICYDESTIKGSDSTMNVHFNRKGICHGLMVWIVYYYNPPSDTKNNIIISSLKDAPYNQIIRLLSEPVTVEQDDLGKARFTCKSSFGGVNGTRDSHQFVISVTKKTND